MYLPKQFEENDRSSLLGLIRTAPLGTLVLQAPHGLEANHLPFIHCAADNEPGVLRAHIPRSNPLAQLLEHETATATATATKTATVVGAATKARTECLVIFNGPDGYISPSWYATKQKNGEVVPTWNYAVVHVHGTIELIDDADWVLAQIEALTGQLESKRPEPWAVTDAPAEFTRRLRTSLVGLEVSIAKIVGKTKVSQNQPRQNQISVLEALAREQPDSALTRLMRSKLG